MKIIQITFPQNREEKIKILEQYEMRVYSDAYDFNYFEERPEEKDYLLRDIIKSQYGLLLEIDNQIIGFLNYDFVSDNNLTILYIREICILRKYQGRGYSKLLREEIFKLYDPDILYGEAQNPISVKSRDIVANEHGYLTYWAEEPVRSTYLQNAKIPKISKRCVELFDPENANSYMDGVKEYTIFQSSPSDQPSNILELKKIQGKIQRMSKIKYKSAFGVLLSIKNDLL